MVGRIAIDDIRPSTPNGYPAKGVAGTELLVSCDLIADGHDQLAARVRFRHVNDTEWADAVLCEEEGDRWEGLIVPERVGRHELVVEAWKDRWGTWLHDTRLKLEAGADIGVELGDGAILLEERAKVATSEVADQLAGAIDALRDLTGPQDVRFDVAGHPSVGALMAGPLRPSDLVAAPPKPVWVDRERAMTGAWYELFPRSAGGIVGTTKRLDDIAAMGFDIVYLPPVHPIGHSHRKGPGNSLVAGPDDPGSPWAIGSEQGGHDTLHPELGTLKDFAALVDRARELGMEIALDYALQASPDHPWAKEHPEWFTRRSDGSIAYAENPPKKYQDIYPINFWPDEEADRVALWSACRDVLEVWIQRGVLVFRVDNPHTKPLAFWEWLIADVHSRTPEVVFLAEAFTKPKMMARLAEVGFSQSYTYFTWRTEAWELAEYLLEVSEDRTADYMRPNFWPTTPDILAGPLRDGPPAAFRLRALLAALMVPSWGCYSGYELCENVPASATNEEFFASEKFELKRREWKSPGSLTPFITSLNTIRRRHPSLQRLPGARVHSTDNEQLLAFSRMTPDRSDVVLVVANLDPHNVQSGWIHLDLEELRLPADEPYVAVDELTGESFEWSGSHPWVRLDPEWTPGHVLHLRRATPAP
jgi:starch synthase (maltosyl-transferring)